MIFIDAKADNPMSRISDYLTSWWNEHFSLTFRLFAHSFQMNKWISFHSGNFSPDKLKQKMVNKTRISIQKIMNETRISSQHTVYVEVEELHVTMQKLPNQLPTSYSTSKSRTCVSFKKKQIKARKWAWWARISHISVRQVLTWRFHKWAWPFMTPLTSPFVTRSSLLFVSLSVNCFAADSLWQRAKLKTLL